MRNLIWTISLCVATSLVGACVFAYREHVRNTIDIVDRQSWPRELVNLITDANTNRDRIEDVDVRNVGFITTYAWRMAASDERLKLHIDRFQLSRVPPNGIEHERILSRFPPAWDLPTDNVDVFANPVGLPGADDGEFEFVLLHDKSAGMIYFYYYFNF